MRPAAHLQKRGEGRAKAKSTSTSTSKSGSKSWSKNRSKPKSDAYTSTFMDVGISDLLLSSQAIALHACNCPLGA